MIARHAMAGLELQERVCGCNLVANMAQLVMKDKRKTKRKPNGT